MSSTSKDAVTLRAKRSKKPSDGKMRRNVEIFVLSAPAILLFVCFVILPIVLGAYYGFYQWKGYGLPSKTGKFVGLQNYITALKDPAFQAAILHTFEVVIGSLVIQAPLAILFALLLNQKFKGRGLIRTLIFVPYVVSEVIVGTGWSLLLQKKGAINEILANFGINGPDWLADPKIAIWTLLLLISWKYVGFAVILMLAGMQSIPDELYEAAKVDGLVERIFDELGYEATVVATGGLVHLVAPYCKRVDVVNETLTLEGLRIIAQRNTERS